MPKLPITVELTGENGNVFNLIAVVSKAMKKNGYRKEAKDFQAKIFGMGSYDEALQEMMRWVTVE